MGRAGGRQASSRDGMAPRSALSRDAVVLLDPSIRVRPSVVAAYGAQSALDSERILPSLPSSSAASAAHTRACTDEVAGATPRGTDSANGRPMPPLSTRQQQQRQPPLVQPQLTQPGSQQPQQQAQHHRAAAPAATDDAFYTLPPSPAKLLLQGATPSEGYANGTLPLTTNGGDGAVRLQAGSSCAQLIRSALPGATNGPLAARGLRRAILIAGTLLVCLGLVSAQLQQSVVSAPTHRRPFHALPRTLADAAEVASPTSEPAGMRAHLATALADSGSHAWPHKRGATARGGAAQRRHAREARATAGRGGGNGGRRQQHP